MSTWSSDATLIALKEIYKLLRQCLALLRGVIRDLGGKVDEDED